MSNKTIKQTWTFSPLDTWFFKQALSPDSLAAQELTSLFPPSPRTLIGAIRASVGEANGVDWQAYRAGQQPRIEALIGTQSDVTPPDAQFTGVFIANNGERYYPMPLNWLGKKTNHGYEVFKMQPSEQAMVCDLGKVRLPVLIESDSNKTAGAKPLENLLILASKLNELLSTTQAYATLSQSDCLEKSDLFIEEARLGIARNNATRKAEEGKLYQTKHLRLKEGVALQLDCAGWQANQHSSLMTLGGEGRLAHLEIMPYQALPSIKAKTAKGIILTLATPAKFDNGWLPNDFTKVEKDGIDCWQGNINGINLSLHCATLGKAHREGGWNIKSRSARDVESFVPAGSSYFCTVDNGDIHAAIQALHLAQIGDYTQLGRGQIVVGIH